MRKTPYILIIILLLSVSLVQAEVVVLQSGKTITGDVLLQNEQIIMIKDAEGKRFQIPRTEIVSINQQVEESVANEDTLLNSPKGNCALRLDLAGGGLFLPSIQTGGAASVDIQIGCKQIGTQRIFLGGSIGYQAAIADHLYNFLPLMMVVSMPLMEGKHAPEIGAALGYGFALKQPSKGGIAAKMDVSWRYQYKSSSALLLGIQARFQQAQVTHVETIENKQYTSLSGNNFVTLGLRLAFEF